MRKIDKFKYVFLFFLILAFFFTIPQFMGATPKYFPYLQDRCAVHEVPLDVAYAVAIVESNFEMVISRPNSNGTYDIGIFQLNSAFVDWFEEALWYEKKSFDPYNAENNIEMGVIYLKHLYKQTGSWDLAIRAYNTGLHALAYDPDRSWAYFIKVVNTITTLGEKNGNN